MKEIQPVMRHLWATWKRFGKAVADYQARVLLGIFYFLIFAPFSLIAGRLDPLGIKRSNTARWSARENSTEIPLALVRRQF